MNRVQEHATHRVITRINTKLDRVIANARLAEFGRVRLLAVYHAARAIQRVGQHIGQDGMTEKKWHEFCDASVALRKALDAAKPFAARRRRRP